MIKSNLAGNFLRDKNVASVFPTTKKTVSKICSSIDFEKNIIIVEYGPGTGIFTEYLLSKMNKDSKLIFIEKNKNLSFFLKNKFKDKRLRIFNDSAENIKDILKKEKIR
ncbi:MAG: rRNA adenine N-6-methyltransferase family protein, partial [Candidatus Pacebacteria bacterium]|nr:rRNA adenine N-6-methyltransferase family protein [Candidatus Paceibacterota bacterium]